MIEDLYLNAPGFWLYLTCMVFWLGACVGSFLNVCIYRIPLDLSIVTPRSHCPHCGTQIAWYHNIPLFSWLALRARCRYCGGGISARYFAVELLTAALFVLAWFTYSPVDSPRPLGLAPCSSLGVVACYWLIVYGLVLGTFVDLEHMIIPDRVTLGGIVAGLALSLAVPDLHRLPAEAAITARAAFMRAVLGAAVGSGSLYLVARLGKLIYRKDAMGLGDVKLIGAIGAFLGWRAVFFTIMGSSFVGALAGIVLILLRKKDMQSRIPYGPFIAIAALVWMLWGSQWWYAYTHWFMYMDKL